jgi:glucosamine--fructose-6-phosphate aminotransferase (isomerizing)
MPKGQTNSGRGDYQTYMEKEIWEVPRAIGDTIKTRMPPFPTNARSVYLIGCGSAYHAALIGELLLESRGITARAMLASEFRYRLVPIGEDTPIILISQSGETADTLAALRIAKERGAPTYAIVNVATSAIAREASFLLHTKAGVEVAVATTKAYCAQIACLYQWIWGEMPTKVVNACEEALQIEIGHIVEELAGKAHAFFIGRGVDAAICREGCLKLKEISYLHAESYEAGELKHGTISLIERGTPVIAVVTDPAIAKKTLSNIEEVLARGARVWAVTTEALVPLLAGYDKIVLPAVSAPFTALPAAVVLERLALAVALSRGYDPDKPRNLAKSVTVE